MSADLLTAARFAVENCGLPKPADVESLLVYVREDEVGASEMCDGCIRLLAAIALAEPPAPSPEPPAPEPRS